MYRKGNSKEITQPFFFSIPLPIFYHLAIWAWLAWSSLYRLGWLWDHCVNKVGIEFTLRTNITLKGTVEICLPLLPKYHMCIISRLPLFLSVLLPRLDVIFLGIPSSLFLHCCLLYRFPILYDYLFSYQYVGCLRNFVITSKAAVSVLWLDCKHTFVPFLLGCSPERKLFRW